MSQILIFFIEHYETQTATLLSLPTLNEEAFNKAINWAKNRYKRKLTDASVTVAKSLLQGEEQTPEGGFVKRLVQRACCLYTKSEMTDIQDHNFY